MNTLEVTHPRASGNAPTVPAAPDAPQGADSIRQSNDWRRPRRLLLTFVLIWAVLGIAPVSRQDWLLENLLVFTAVPVLYFTRRRLRLSDASYGCLFVFLVLHSIGAHYTYSLVPYDRWFEAVSGHTISEIFGWERNHYDRAVHFLYGALILLPAVELFDRYAPPRSTWRWLMPVLFVMSHSVIYEMMEWVAALIVAPELGDAYLGTQGDGWDAQKDMALATCGSIAAMSVLRLRAAVATR